MRDSGMEKRRRAEKETDLLYSTITYHKKIYYQIQYRLLLWKCKLLLETVTVNNYENK